ESDTRLELRRGARDRRAGRVLSCDGRPLAAVRVTPAFAIFPDDGLGEESEAWMTSLIETRAASTDAAGSFCLPDLPSSVSTLLLEGGDLLVPVVVRSDPVGLACEIRVARGARFQLRLAQPGRADAFALEDPRGVPEPLYAEAAGDLMGVPRASLE